MSWLLASKVLDLAVSTPGAQQGRCQAILDHINDAPWPGEAARPTDLTEALIYHKL